MTSEVITKYQRSAPLPVGEETPLLQLAELSAPSVNAVVAALDAADEGVLAGPSPLEMTMLE